MIDLTAEERSRLEGGKVVDVIDAETSQHYIVMKKELYENVCRLLCDDADWSHDELRLQLARSSNENGWEEPAMDAYDRYDEERHKT
jgi:hypothetical protein